MNLHNNSMTIQDLKEINNRLKCPICLGNDIILFFINESSQEVHPSYVNHNQQASEFAHICICEDCGNTDDRCFFDHVEYDKWKKSINNN